jgi:predicted RNA-binding Zn-ribbon protein involved in translation (DUF1610 family)
MRKINYYFDEEDTSSALCCPNCEKADLEIDYTYLSHHCPLCGYSNF